MDRRRSHRLQYAVEASLWKDGVEHFPIHTCNLSRHGVGMLVDRPLEPETFYVIELALGPKTITSEIRIISCRKTEDGRFEVGAEFCEA
jgi:hypothetical protein